MKPSIKCAENGPYVVTNLEQLRNSKGETIPTDQSVALCRCGGSSKKPFCGGTHAKIGFSGAKQTDGGADKRVDYTAKTVTIHDNRGICAHAGFCTDNLASVFRLRTEPWIDPEGESVDKIVEAVNKCPSGALSYSIDGVEHRDQDRNPMITATKDGPYAVVGGVELVGETFGEGASMEHYTLCRCGGSKNKPFCDGSHWRIKFNDETG